MVSQVSLCDFLGTLTALQLHRAGLYVHGEVLEVHRAGQNESQPGRDRKKEARLAEWGSAQHRDLSPSPQPLPLAPSSLGHLPAAPDAVEHVSILEDAQQLVVCGHLVETGPFLIGKEQVWLPDQVQHGGIEVQRVIRIFSVGQAWVVPLLSQEDIHPVVLGEGRDGPIRGSVIVGTSKPTWTVRP